MLTLEQAFQPQHPPQGPVRESAADPIPVWGPYKALHREESLGTAPPKSATPKMLAPRPVSRCLRVVKSTDMAEALGEWRISLAAVTGGFLTQWIVQAAALNFLKTALTVANVFFPN